MQNAENLRTIWAESQDRVTRASQGLEEREQFQVRKLENDFLVHREQFEAATDQRFRVSEEQLLRRYESLLLEHHTRLQNEVLAEEQQMRNKFK